MYRVTINLLRQRRSAQERQGIWIMKLKVSFFVTTIAMASIGSANLLQNGDFSLGSSAFWDVTNPDGNTLVSNANLLSGTYSAYFGSSPDAGAFAQTVATTVGTTYTLTYQLADENAYFPPFSPIGDQGESFKTQVNGSTVKSYGYFTGTASETYVFVAGSASTTINFTGTNPGFSYELGHVDLEAQAVPEPASIAVLGISAVALLRRRKN